MNHGTYNGYKHYGCRCRKCVKAYKEACERGKAKYKAQMANPNDPRHGTITGYQYGCRCDKCKAADKAYNKQEKNYHKKKMADPNHPKHGTVTGYGYGCRCDRCREANNEYNLRYRYKRKEKIMKAKENKSEMAVHVRYMLCIKAGQGFEENKVYPQFGDNNGLHIFRLNEYKEPLHYLAHSYGNNDDDTYHMITNDCGCEEKIEEEDAAKFRDYVLES